jgi:hypothetical protein
MTLNACEYRGRPLCPASCNALTCEDNLLEESTMKRHYGVACKSPDCEAVFVFAEVRDISPTAQVEFPVPPLKPLVCPICKKGHQYDSDDVVEIGYLDPLESVRGHSS